MISTPAQDEELPFLVAALYRFATLADPAAVRTQLLELCDALGLRGTLLVAHEGINGTVAGHDEAIAGLIANLEAMPALTGLDVKYSRAAEMPFHRMKVRIKKEIVTMGVADLDPVTDAGTYVEPKDWNRLIGDPDTVVIDTRNDYEVQLGTFEGAVDPQTRSFSSFPQWAMANRTALEGRKVAMFCTGGIRCEKATAFVRSLGIDEVYHLKGGILRYLEEVPEAESRWQGECFVFDERVAVTHALAQGSARLCRACRRPLMPQDLASPHHVEGVACLHCHEERSEADRARYEQRQRQVELAEARGGPRHIGR